MWTLAVDVMHQYATFKCDGCNEMSMTPPDMIFADITSAFARFKQKHKACDKGL